MIIDSFQGDDTQFKKLNLNKLKKKPLGDDPESKYWKSFKEIFTKDCSQTIKQVCSSQNDKNLVAYTDGMTIEIFSTKKKQVKKTLQRFKTQLNSLAFRQDGSLLVTGHENGQIDVFNIKTKLPLRMFKNFKKAVQAVTFDKVNQEHIFGASDEGIVKLFDVTQESVVRSIPQAHNDFIRSIEVLGNDEFHLLTGSYDKTIKLFDFRAQNNLPVLTFNVLDPVEGLAVLNQSNNFVSVQGVSTILWDLRTANMIQQLQVNQKTISGVRVVQGSDGQQRIITYGLDHQLKFIRPDIFQVVYQTKFDNPLMSADITKDGQSLILGDALGKILIKQRNPKQFDGMEEDEDKGEKDFIPKYLLENPYLKKRIRNFQFFNRGIYQTPNTFDVKINSEHQQKLGAYDRLLVQFKYKEALMKALSDKQSQVVVSLCEEFISRGAFEICFHNLSEEELDLVMSFIKLKIVNPKFQETCLYIGNHLLSNYPAEFMNNHKDFIDIVKQEKEAQQQMIQMIGILEALIKN